MNTIISTMKIHNHLIVSTIQIYNKKLLANNNILNSISENTSLWDSNLTDNLVEESNGVPFELFNGINTHCIDIKSPKPDITYTSSICEQIDIQKNNNTEYNYDNYTVYSDNEYDYFSDDEYIEYENCENCDRKMLYTLLNNGLCEMCLFKRKRKIQIFNQKMCKK